MKKPNHILGQLTGLSQELIEIKGLSDQNMRAAQELLAVYRNQVLLVPSEAL